MSEIWYQLMQVVLETSHSTSVVVGVSAAAFDLHITADTHCQMLKLL